MRCNVVEIMVVMVVMEVVVCCGVVCRVWHWRFIENISFCRFFT